MSQDPSPSDDATATALSHDDVELLFEEYEDGSLGAAQRRQVDAHLSGCPTCATVYADLRATSEALSGLHAAAPITLTQAVETTIHTRSAGRFFANRRATPLGQWVFGGPGLLVALVLLLGLLAFVAWLARAPSGVLAPPRSVPATIEPTERIAPSVPGDSTPR